MKIIELNFTNINNLKGGPHIVSFDKEPLRSSGLFGILGPTGSGKSTLLDVITLALFNRIPRFSKQISKKEISELGSVMTHHSDYAEASITYQIKNKTYTSKWSISKARTGNLKDYEMYLIDSDGKYADLKKSQVPSENENIIGLNYDQFIKSIILSQGEFAKFLKANKNERGLLLEKITGASIYRDIGKKVYAFHKEKKSQLNQELQTLEEIKIKPEEVIKQLIAVKEQSEKDKNNLTLKHKHLSHIKILKENITKNKSEVFALREKQQSLVNEIERFKPTQQKINLHEKLLPIKGDLLKLKDLKNSLKKIHFDIEENKEKLIRFKKEFELSIQEMSILTKQNVTAENFKSTMSLFENEVKELTKDIETIQLKGKDERSRINKKLEQLHDSETRSIFSSTNDPKAALKILDKEKENLSNVLKKANLSSNNDKSEIRKNLQQAREEQSTLNLLIRNIQNQSKLTEQYNKYTIDKANESQAVTETEPELIQISTLLATTQELVTSLYNEKNASIKIAKLEELRSELIDNEPCPLCGSTSHPFHNDNPNIDISKIDLRINETSEKVKSLESQKSVLDKKITQHKTNIGNLSSQISHTSSQIETLKKEIESLDSDATSLKGLELSNLKNSLKDKEVKIFNLEKCQEAIDKILIFKDLYLNYENLLKISVSYKELNTQLNDKFTGEDISKVCNAIQDRFTAASRSIEDLERDNNQCVKSIQTITEDISNLEKALHPKRKVLNFDNFDLMLSSLLNEEDFLRLREKDNNLKAEILKTTTQIDAIQKELSTNISKDNMPDNSLEEVTYMLQSIESERELAIRKIGENNAIIESEKELKKRRSSKEKKINKLQLHVENWSLMNQLIGDKDGNKFANYAQGLTLQNLLSLANKRLAKLSDRYLLDKPKNDELQVIDLYQGNIQRSVTTLSGGETFLISLALALSLSDMASKNVPLESLFIDEGFGTLDQDTLDMALSTLEKLQSESQKTIGIISHVEALKERIDVQIHLDKNAQGYSKIRLQS